MELLKMFAIILLVAFVTLSIYFIVFFVLMPPEKELNTVCYEGHAYIEGYGAKLDDSGNTVKCD